MHYIAFYLVTLSSPLGHPTNLDIHQTWYKSQAACEAVRATLEDVATERNRYAQAFSCVPVHP